MILSRFIKFIILVLYSNANLRALYYTKIHKFSTDQNIMIIYDEYTILSKWKIVIGRNNIKLTPFQRIW